MTSFHIFVIRCILASACSVVLMRMFRPDMHIAFSILLGAFIVCASYFSQYMRNRRKK